MANIYYPQELRAREVFEPKQSTNIVS